MEVEVIGGVHTIFHTSKEHTKQLLANLLFRFYCENRIKQIKKEQEEKQDIINEMAFMKCDDQKLEDNLKTEYENRIKEV